MTTNPVHLLLVAVIQDQDLDTATKALQTIGQNFKKLILSLLMETFSEFSRDLVSAPQVKYRHILVHRSSTRL